MMNSNRSYTESPLHYLPENAPGGKDCVAPNLNQPASVAQGLHQLLIVQTFITSTGLLAIGCGKTAKGNFRRGFLWSLWVLYSLAAFFHGHVVGSIN